MKDLTIVQAKRFGIVACRAEDSLAQAAREMFEREISCLIVVSQDGSLTGVITRMDLVRAARDHEDWLRLPVGQVMTTDVVTCPTDATLGQVMDLLISQRIHRVVAVEEQDGKRIPCTVLSAADIVYHMARQAADGPPE